MGAFVPLQDAPELGAAWLPPPGAAPPPPGTGRTPAPGAPPPLGEAAEPDDAELFPAALGDPVEPALDPALGFADLAAAELAGAAAVGVPELTVPVADAAGAGELEVVPVTPAPADPTPVPAVAPVPADPASPPGTDWAPGLGPVPLSRAASARNRPSSRRLPQALAPAAITASTTANVMRRRRLRVADVLVDVMRFPPFCRCKLAY
jgi:hypothetical protein